MRKLRLTISYDGTNYVGWQVQPNGISIQEKLQDAFFRMTGERTNVIAAGRTDAGVHAVGQVAHVEMKGGIPCDGIKRGINSILPSDIALIGVEEARPDFHAMRDAIGKRYMYRLLICDHRIPLMENRCWRLTHDLDVDSMRAAAKALIGRRDFESFRAAGCTSRHAIVDLKKIQFNIFESPDTLVLSQGKVMNIVFEGDRFVRHMIRNIVGTLVDVGQGNLRPDDVAGILDQKNRQAAGICAPACGLYLVGVSYAPGSPSESGGVSSSFF